MRHPAEGILRRLVDDPAGVGDAEREHVAHCPDCLAGVAAAQHDATLTAAALDVPVRLDAERAWQHLADAVTTGQDHRSVAVGSARRWQTRLRSPVVAGVGVVAVLTGASAAAAGDWLRIFSTEEVAAVAVTEEDLVRLPDLTRYGDVNVVDGVRVREVPSASAAEEASGLEAPEVDELPPGVTGQPAFHVLDQVTATFTFSAAEARENTATGGEPLPPVPPGLDGSEFRLEAGPGLAAIWSEQRGVPALLVARAVAPAGYSSGVPFETARDYLLSLPGLPEDVASQLRSFSGDGTTLPIPVPEDHVTSSSTDVDGVDATLLEARDGTMAAVVWVADGVVTVVAGSLDDDEVLAVARGLA